MDTPNIIEHLSDLLVETRENHPSFKLMNNKIDESLFPKGIITFEAEAYDSNEKLKTVKEIVEDSWSKGKKNHLMIEGEGGIGKTVTLLSLPDKIAPRPVPAIYIPLHDIRGTGDEDLIERYIKKEVLEEDEELFRQLKTLRRTKWEKGPILLLLLDGFNELSSDTLRGSVSRDIERWAKYPGVQIITSSRFDIRKYVSLQSDFSKIELQRISKEKVREYLDREKVPFPNDVDLINHITNPLFLTLYIKTEIIRSQRSSSFARFRDTKNAGTLIWNYLQCELWRFRNDQINDAKPGVIAMEFIAPYIAWKMQQQSCFSLSELEFNTLVKEAHASLEAHIANPSELPSHISIILQQSNELPQRNRLSILLKEYLGIFVEFREKDNDGNDVVRYKLMHQQFRDVLAAMHLINLSYLSGNSLPQEWNSPIDFYVLHFVADLIREDTDNNEALKLWEQNRETTPSIENATRNQLRLQGLLHSNDFSHLDFSGLDLRNISLYPYRIGNTLLKMPSNADKTKDLKLSIKTFAAEGHEDTVNSVVITSDGKYIISGSKDKSLRIWDLETGAQIGIIEGHNGEVNSVAVTQNGKYIISGSMDKTVRIWNFTTKTQYGDPLEGHQGAVSTVAVTRDGTRIISGSWDGTIRVWDFETRRQLGKPFDKHKSVVSTVMVSSDGTRVVSGSWDNTICVWDIDTKELIVDPIEGHEYSVRSLFLTQDGKRIISGSNDKTIRVTDFDTGRAEGKPIDKLGSPVVAVSATPDGKNIIGLSDTKTISVWSMKTRKQIVNSLKGHSSYINSLVVTPDGKRIISGSSDKTIRIWEIETGALIGKPIQGHNNSVDAIAVTPDGKRFISRSSDDTIRIWDLEKGILLGKPIEEHSNSIYAVAVTPNGKRVVIGSLNALFIWDLEKGIRIGKIINGHVNSVYAVVATSKRIVSRSLDTMRIWDLETGNPIGNPIAGHSHSTYAMTATLDGKYIVSGFWDKTIRIWDSESGIQIGKPIEGHSNSIDSVVVTPDNKHIISGAVDAIRIWDFDTKIQIGKFGGSSEYKPIWGMDTKTRIGNFIDSVFSLAVTPDGNIISRSSDNIICIWDFETRSLIGKPIEGQGNSDYAATSNGIKGISGFNDGTIRITNLYTEDYHTIRILPLSVAGLDFSKAEITDDKLKETLRQNGAKVDPD